MLKSSIKIIKIILITYCCGRGSKFLFELTRELKKIGYEVETQIRHVNKGNNLLDACSKDIEYIKSKPVLLIDGCTVDAQDWKIALERYRQCTKNTKIENKDG